MSEAIVLRLSPELADYLGMLMDEADDKGEWPIQLAEALAAARRVPPENAQTIEWKPIKTAPKDGTIILVYDPDGIEPGRSDFESWPELTVKIFPARFDCDHPNGPPCWKWTCPFGEMTSWPSDGPSYNLATPKPTHWMPLPEPPDPQSR